VSAVLEGAPARRPRAPEERETGSVSVQSPEPQNLDAEERVLGAIMVASTPEAGAATVAAIRGAGLVAADFYRPSHGLIYAAALDLVERGEPTDALLLEHELRERRQLLDAGGRERLVELAGLVPAIANAGHYAKLVVEAAERREQAEVGLALRAGAENGSLVSDPRLRERVAHLLEDRRSAAAHTWRSLDVLALGNEPPTRPTIGNLLYPGRRHVVSGEFDAGKSWLLLRSPPRR
jgi:DnaB-like helicase N terminal domain